MDLAVTSARGVYYFELFFSIFVASALRPAAAAMQGGRRSSRAGLPGGGQIRPSEAPNYVEHPLKPLATGVNGPASRTGVYSGDHHVVLAGDILMQVSVDMRERERYGASVRRSCA